MTFVSQLCIESRASHWILREDLVYRGRDEVIVATRNFRTDLGSLPWLAGWLIPPTITACAGAVLHSFCYTYTPLVLIAPKTPAINNFSPMRPITRKEADGLLKRSLVESGVSSSRAMLIYYLCRLLGGTYWDKARVRKA